MPLNSGSEILICPQCRNIFVSYKSNHRECCSQKCARKYILYKLHQQGLSHWRKGVKYTPELIRKIVKSRRAHSGYKHSEETKRKISLTCKKKNVIQPILNWMKGKHHTEETKKKIGLANKKGIRPLPKKIRQRKTTSYEIWRTDVFKRDNYTCQKCGNHSGNGKVVYLQAHHLKSWIRFPKLRYVISNGITFCLKCHKKEHQHRR